MKDRHTQRAKLAIKLIDTLRDGVIEITGRGAAIHEVEVETIAVLSLMITHMPERSKWRFLRLMAHAYAELAPDPPSGSLGRPQHTQ